MELEIFLDRRCGTRHARHPASYVNIHNLSMVLW